MPAAERMSRVDTAWLRMDNDVNLMMIVGVWLLQPALDYEQLCARVAEKLLRYDRFKQKVVQDAIGAQWVDDEDFDIHHHVVREKLVRRKGQSERAALQALCGITDGPFIEAKEALGGFYLIEARDLDEALELAAGCPGAKWGAIEVRPVLEFPTEAEAIAVGEEARQPA